MGGVECGEPRKPLALRCSPQNVISERRVVLVGVAAVESGLEHGDEPLHGGVGVGITVIEGGAVEFGGHDPTVGAQLRLGSRSLLRGQEVVALRAHR